MQRWAQQLPSGSRVLDVGAGPCRYRSLFAHCEYKAHDHGKHVPVAKGPMAEANFKYGQLDYVSDATSIPVPDASFDAVLCTEVIEHVPEPILVVREIARILRGGGRLLLTAPLGSGVHQDPDHYYGGYTPYWYRRFLADAGFEAIEVTANGGFFKHYGQESQRFSTLLDPRRLTGLARFAVAPLWCLSFPYFRMFMPVVCHLLDPLDRHRSFTVGYHVLAQRSQLIRGDSQAVGL